MTGLPLIVFDVNETLLDLESLAPTFERIFGERSVLRLWFAQLVLYSEALTLAGTYVPFTDIGGAVLKMVATTCGTSISAADRAELTEKFASMPPHPEVTDALRKLRHAGFRLCTLTNNGRPRLPSPRMPICDISCALRQWFNAGFSPYQSTRLSRYNAGR